MRRSGFTLVEVLIVIAISALLSTIAILYSSTSRNQVALSVETARVAQTILEAKELAVATYATPGSGICGYGASINAAAGTYSIFAYKPQNHANHGVPPPCPDDDVASTTPIFQNEMAQYSPGTWNVKLATGVKFDGTPADALTVVIFYPPNPDTFISRAPVSPPPDAGQALLDPGVVNPVTSNVYLVTTDGSKSAMITVNGAGQVTF